MTPRATAAPDLRPRTIARRALVGCCCSCAALVALTGCFSRERPDIDSPDAALKIPAIKASVRQRQKTVRVATRLVADLESDDPAVRFYAIQGLQRLTGQTFGDRYYDDDARRKPAVVEWKAWLAQVRGEPPPTTTAPTSAPTSAPTTAPI